MRALIKRGSGATLSLEQLPDPAPGPGEVVVDISAVGVCGTDLHILHDVYAHADPLVPGHELTGVIRTLGEGVTGWSEGERIVSELHTGADRDCRICRSGNPQICPSKRALGTWTDGAFAERVALPAWLLHRPPAGLSDQAATMIEPAACSLHAMTERSRVLRGDHVLIVGHGPIGLLCAQIARAHGAGSVIVAGRSSKGTARLDAARRMEVDVVDTAHEDLEERIAQTTGGLGVDLAVEAAGAEEALSACVRACRPGGRVLVVGLVGRKTVSFPWDAALVRDLDVAFSFSSRASSWERVIELCEAGQLIDETMVTHRFALERWEAAFAASASGDAVKVVLEP